MEVSGSFSQLRDISRALSRRLARSFPTPAVLAPRAAGIDISDASVKWLVLAPFKDAYRIQSFGEIPLPEGAVVGGVVQDVETLARTLRDVKEHLDDIALAHAALPEEAAYVFEMHVPEATPREQVLRMIEFEFEGRVPIPPSAAVYDFDVILARDDGQGEEIGVSVFPRDLAESYAAAFDASGIALLSLEIEARSIARAVSSCAREEPITLLVDFGRARSGFAVLKRGIPIFTSTVEVGGDVITKTLMEKMSLSAEGAEEFRNEQGLRARGAPKQAAGSKASGGEAIVGVASALADEIARHYRYWDTRRNEHGERMTPVGKVILVGGSANLNGLPEYIAARVQAPTELGDVWRHIARFDTYIPPIDRRHSLQYATAAGLALRGLRYEDV